MTPLLHDIERLRQEAIIIRAGRPCDEMTSLNHVKFQALFRKIYCDGELMGQIGHMMAQERLIGLEGLQKEETNE